MAIFGMNGLFALALDFALVFAVYGMKEVALTKTQVESVARVVARKGLSGDKATDAFSVQAARAQILRGMSGPRYSSTTEAQRKAFGAKTWLR